MRFSTIFAAAVAVFASAAVLAVPLSDTRIGSLAARENSLAARENYDFFERDIGHFAERDMDDFLERDVSDFVERDVSDFPPSSLLTKRAGETCDVCMEKVHAKARLCTGSKKHELCLDCMARLKKDNKTCPLCRSPLDDPAFADVRYCSPTPSPPPSPGPSTKKAKRSIY